MVRLVSNPELIQTIQEGLKRNKEKYGKRYCPCSLERTDDVCVRNLEKWIKEFVIVEFI